MIFLWCASLPQHIAHWCYWTGSSAEVIGFGLFPFLAFFFLIIIWLVFKTVSENSCRFVLALSEHSECSELRLTDSGENQTHLFLLGQRQSQVIYVWGESDNEGEGQQFKWCVLTLNCRKHLAWAAYASDEVCASKCCNYLCISTQCNLLWG